MFILVDIAVKPKQFEWDAVIMAQLKERENHEMSLAKLKKKVRNNIIASFIIL